MDNQTDLKLTDGARVAVMGGGPAGSFFSYFLLEMARRAGLDVEVDIFEPRDFSVPGPPGCNMCGGIVSESLVQNLASEGINLPPTVVQRGISAYVMHSDVGSVRINTPAEEKRIGAVYRGPGPKGLKEFKWGSFDGHMQALATAKGAHIIKGRVDEVKKTEDGRLSVKARGGQSQTYDLLAVTAGINTAAHRLFEHLQLPYRPPKTTKTFIREYFLGEETIARTLGSAMHVFLLNLPRLEFAAIIPKGDYATLCLLGEEIDDELVSSLIETPEVKRLMPPDLRMEAGDCQCQPRISVEGAVQPFGDRIVFIGDCGVTRLYKDGIGSAYRTAKAAATTAVFDGVSAEDFRRRYLPACCTIENDNHIGKFVFFVVRLIQEREFARRAVLSMTAAEQRPGGPARRMSLVLWDMFTGSAPYREIFMRTLHPVFIGRLVWNLLVALFSRGETSALQTAAARATPAPADAGALGKVFEPGEIIFRQGEVGDCMYAIQEGQVALVHEQDGGETFLGVRSAGEFIGEMALFDKEVHSATVRALSQARVLTVDQKNFTRRIHEDPSLAFRLFQVMSRRVRELSREVALLNRETDRLSERGAVLRSPGVENSVTAQPPLPGD